MDYPSDKAATALSWKPLEHESRPSDVADIDHLTIIENGTDTIPANGHAGTVPGNGHARKMPTNGDADMQPANGHEETMLSNGRAQIRTVDSNTGVTAKNDHENGMIANANTEDKQKKKSSAEKPDMISLGQLFKYADGLDWLMMFFGTIGALAHGVAQPALILIFGNVIDSFTSVGDFCTLCNDTLVTIGATNVSNLAFLVHMLNHTCNDIIKDDAVAMEVQNKVKELNYSTSSGGASFSQDKLLDQMHDNSLWFVVVGCGVLVFTYIQIGLWSLSAHRQAHRIKVSFFRSILHQDMGWFDTTNPGELTTRMADDIDKIQDGIGEKLAILIQSLSTCIAGIIVAFTAKNGWKLTLVILACSPLLVLGSAILAKVSSRLAGKEQQAYAKAGGIAEEVLSSIRTVVAFGGQQKETKRYSENLTDAKVLGIRKSLLSGVGLGYVFFIIYAEYALGFWYGTTLVLNGEISFGTLIVVFFSILIGAFGLGTAAPSIQSLATARGAALIVYQIIDRVPAINCQSVAGAQPSKTVGTITFRNVRFNYPSRPDVKVLQGLDLTIHPGQTVALVGSSGCGKSTTVQLIQRFYDPESGTVELDGQDIRSLNLRWLRRQIGIVSQEPILFATTIAENIRYGREGVTEEEIVKAAEEANAHDFISKLPLKYNTLVGERGAQLSGGQKQRIAIARALVNTPKILLLDEATSALDTESESTVQAALDKAREGRTTIVIAHRLSTIRTADIIVGIKDGVAVESGTHDELMAFGGLYYQLVTNQQKAHTQSPEAASETEDDSEDEPADVAFHDSHLKRTHSSHSGTRSSKRLDKVLSAESGNNVTDVDQEQKGKDKNLMPKVSFLELLSWNSEEWYFIIIGCFFAIINGGIQPSMAVVFGKIMAVFLSCDNQQIRNESNLYSLLFLIIAIVVLIAMTLQPLMFAYSGESLTVRLRQQSFKAMLRQDISWFDDAANNTGSLTTRLATETSSVQGVSGVRLGSMLQALACVLSAIIIAFINSWQVTLALLAFVPFIAITGFIQMKMFRGQSSKNKKTYEDCGKIATEAISNIRTVQSLSKEVTFLGMFCTKLDPPYKKELKMSQALGFTYGLSHSCTFFAVAGIFYLGAYLIVNKELTFEHLMITFACITFGATSIGQAGSLAPESGKATKAAGYIKALQDRVPKIDSQSSLGEQPSTCTAAVEFRDIVFHYPTRPSVRVLRGMSVSVNPGETLALVGSSGCGKSTSVQLMERFYDVDDGQVILDGKDIRELNTAWLRKQIGIVSQEPILFDCSIAKNIAYGDNSREDFQMADVIAAAKKANIHDFITTLPDGYETNVGSKGTQLSGGQKQRVAIARALLRNPKILLLDEATSALDTESERVVQEALDQARQGRTSIVIAHRLSTIQNADKIAVLRHGQVVEVGNHSELMARKGFYFRLQSIQKPGQRQC